MRFRGFLIVLGGIAAAAMVALACIVAAMWWFFGHPTGTVAEARQLLEAHRVQITELQRIMVNHPTICWVEPDLAIDDVCHGAVHTPEARAAYARASRIMAAIPVRSLAPVRDRKTQKLVFVRFVIFEPGIFGSSKPVMGVWLGPNQDLGEYELHKCQKTNVPAWYVCPFNP